MIPPDSFPDKVPEPSASELLTEVLRLLKREDCIRLYSRVKAALMIQEWPITPESRAREVRLKQAGLVASDRAGWSLMAGSSGGW
jgi:hypothetical protein